jgi:thiol-disulfide isomerase/thioredoxin
MLSGSPFFNFLACSFEIGVENLKKYLLVAIAFVCSIGIQYGVAIAADYPTPAVSGDIFPSFSYQDITGNIVTSDIFKDKELTMINYWDYWCDASIYEMPELGKLARDMPEGTQLIGMLGYWTHYDEDIVKVKNILSQANTDFTQIAPYYLQEFFSEDEGYLTAEDIFYFSGAWLAIPKTVFINSEGKMVGNILEGTHTAEQYRAEILRLLGRSETLFPSVPDNSAPDNSGSDSGSRGGGCTTGGFTMLIAGLSSILVLLVDRSVNN